jgi:ketosteroid isomerase-like protein
MNSEDRIKMIGNLYEAFARGDLQPILDSLDDRVEWGVEASTEVAPWYGVRRGKDGVVSFFTEFGTAMEVDEFTPLSFAANEDSVFAVVRCRARARSTGKAVDMNLHHYFRFDGDKVVYYRGTEDTAAIREAMRA